MSFISLRLNLFDMITSLRKKKLIGKENWLYKWDIGIKGNVNLNAKGGLKKRQKQNKTKQKNSKTTKDNENNISVLVI